MPCRWGSTRPRQLAVAATARVIWLCACVRYWPYRGVVLFDPCSLNWVLRDFALEFHTSRPRPLIQEYSPPPPGRQIKRIIIALLIWVAGLGFWVYRGIYKIYNVRYTGFLCCIFSLGFFFSFLSLPGGGSPLPFRKSTALTYDNEI